jgi:D-glycero-D-manno-heptose 1,7-bisphosphate phosphatase
MTRSAVFFDRDGTLMRDVDFASRPEQVELLPGAAEAVRDLSTAGWFVVLVTNQSGIGRGLFSPDDYARVHARLVDLLAVSGARLDDAYHCPHAPDVECECRKPGTALFERAAREHDLDLASSWCIGDRWRDVAPAQALGATGLLVPSDATPADDRERARDAGLLASSLADAVRRVQREG